MKRLVLCAALAAALAACPRAAPVAPPYPAWTGWGEAAEAARVPVVVETDIGEDIDDTWALAYLLRSPGVDVKLITTTYGKSEARAAIVAKLLEVAQRTDIPVALGAGGTAAPDGGPPTTRQQAWVDGYDLSRYPGTVLRDGAQAVVDAVMRSPVPVRIISIGPSWTVAAALAREPAIASRATFVAMTGSVHVGYDGAPGPVEEWNLCAGGTASLFAPWQRAVITPLDTCGSVRLDGQRFAAVKASRDPLVRALLENNRIWAGAPSLDALTASSTLFDTVAIYLALPGPKPLVDAEALPLAVTGRCLLRIDRGGRRVDVALRWRDEAAFDDLLARSLTR